MHRRIFLKFSLFIFLGSYLFGEDRKELKIIKSVLQHMFPSTKSFFGAQELRSFSFFLYIFYDPSFAKEDHLFLLQGAKLLEKKYTLFLDLSTQEKERALREFEQTQRGKEWLALLLYYGLEAMLGDPIYHGNYAMLGWKNLKHQKPFPMAQKAFGAQDV